MRGKMLVVVLALVCSQASADTIVGGGFSCSKGTDAGTGTRNGSAGYEPAHSREDALIDLMVQQAASL